MVALHRDLPPFGLLGAWVNAEPATERWAGVDLGFPKIFAA
ncbi:MAG TPA: hypothetical protein VN515_00790 [Terriglobales bacterium]|nr:hypothetical protein [Terriglobales bacterium]